MAEINQFGSVKPGTPQVCAHCESLLMDVLDRTATPADQAFFDKHLASCTTCSRMFMDAKRGGAWLEMLRDPRPEPASSLFERIIAQTSGTQAQTADQQNADALPKVPETPGHFVPFPVTPVPAASPYLYGVPRPANFSGAKVLPFRLRNAVHSLGQTMLQPRLVMTAAMAFFSIALTLNLTGVHLSELRAEDLKPSNIRKGIYEAKAHVVRYSDNLRVVYELEARAHDLQHSADADSQPADNKAPEKKDAAPADKPAEQPKRSKPGPGTSRREPWFPDGHMVASAPAEARDLQVLSVTAASSHHAPSLQHPDSQPAMHLKGDLA